MCISLAGNICHLEGIKSWMIRYRRPRSLPAALPRFPCELAAGGTASHWSIAQSVRSCSSFSPLFFLPIGSSRSRIAPTTPRTWQTPRLVVCGFRFGEQSRNLEYAEYKRIESYFCTSGYSQDGLRRSNSRSKLSILLSFRSISFMAVR